MPASRDAGKCGYGAYGMPDTIRTTVEGFGARPLRGVLRAAAGVFLLTSLQASAAEELGRAAQSSAVVTLYTAFRMLDRHELAALALTLGILCFAVLSAVLLVRTRRRLAQVTAHAGDHEIAARTAIDRAYALLLSEPQVLVAWAPGSDEPEIIGDAGLLTGGAPPQHVLAFNTWLQAQSAAEIERCADALRARGVSFAVPLTTLSGRSIEAEGQVVGGRAMLRLREVSGVKYELAELRQRHQMQLDDAAAMRALIESLPAPVWHRDESGALTFVNAAYVQAVEAKNAAEVIEHGMELFDRLPRGELIRAHTAAAPFRGRLPAVIGGERRSLDVITAASPRGSSGIAIDATEAERMRGELRRMIHAHRRTLDQLATGVAIFGAHQRLSFYNTAYRSLWDLDVEFLDDGPTDSSVLDRLRAARKLPDEQDFRQWKGELHEAYRAVEAKEHMWHLPDGRTMRVVTNPNPEGGLSYLLDELTEWVELERRYEALLCV